MERIDDLQVNNLRLIQNSEYFCFGCDAVELANFVSGSKTDFAIDLGAGSGIISILLAGKKGIRTTAVEIDGYMATLCQRNAQLNGLCDLVDVINAPMQQLKNSLQAGSRTIVVSNPPYFKKGSGESRKGNLAAASHEIFVNLSEVVDCAAHLLSTGGKFYIVYPTARMAELIAECSQKRLEPKEIVLLNAKDKSPHLFLMKCAKDGQKGVKVSAREIRTYC